MGVGLTHGFPVSSSGSRTALGDAVGSRTQLYSMVVVAVRISGRAVGDVVYWPHFPIAALGALVVYAATRLINLAEYRRLARFRRSELILALATAAAVLGLRRALRRRRQPSPCPYLICCAAWRMRMTASSGSFPGVAGMHDIDDYPTAATRCPGLRSSSGTTSPGYLWLMRSCRQSRHGCRGTR